MFEAINTVMNHLDEKLELYLKDELSGSLQTEEFSMFKHASPNKKGKLDAKKAKVRTFPSISDALGNSNYGQIFTTPQSDRIYVITRGTWGDKSADKVVKGFKATTPFSQILGYSKRTKAKHGGEVHLKKGIEAEKKENK